MNKSYFKFSFSFTLHTKLVAIAALNKFLTNHSKASWLMPSWLVQGLAKAECGQEPSEWDPQGCHHDPEELEPAGALREQDHNHQAWSFLW